MIQASDLAHCHNLASLEELSAALTRPDDPGEKARLTRLIEAE